MLLAQQAVGRGALRVVVDRDPRLPQRERDVRLRHPEHRDRGVGLVLDQEVEQRVDRVACRRAWPPRASVFPWYFLSAGFCTTPIRTDAGPGISCHSLSQLRLGVQHLPPDASAASAGSRSRSSSLAVAAVVRPGRHEGRDRVEPRRDRRRCRPRCRRRRARAESILATTSRHPAPVALAGDLQMPDLHRDPRLAADPDRLVERGDDLGALRPQVRRVDAAEPEPPRVASATAPRSRRRAPAGTGARSRRRPPPRASPSRTRALICSSSLRRRRPVAVAQDHPPHLGGPDVAREVDPDALLLEPGEVFAERAPVGRRCRNGRSPARSAAMIESLSGAGGAALAGDLGGDALEDLGREARVDQQRQLGLAQHVDEAGRDDLPARVDGLLAPPRCRAGRSRRSARRGCRVAGVPGRAGAVDDAAVADDEVERGRPGRRVRGRRDRGTGRLRRRRINVTRIDVIRRIRLSSRAKRGIFRGGYRNHRQDPSLRSG